MDETTNIRVDGIALELLEEDLNTMRESADELRDDPTACELVRQKLSGAVETLLALGMYTTVDEQGRLRVMVQDEDYGAEQMATDAVAEELGVSEGRVRQLLTEDPPRLRGTKVGSAWLVERSSVERYKETRRPYERKG